MAYEEQLAVAERLTDSIVQAANDNDWEVVKALHAKQYQALNDLFSGLTEADQTIELSIAVSQIKVKTDDVLMKLQAQTTKVGGELSVVKKGQQVNQTYQQIAKY